MNLPFFLARRYLFSKKSHSAINIISGVSVCGVALATAALICVLSVFNGFRELIGGLYSTFDPQLEVVPVHGKFAAADDAALRRAAAVDGVALASACLEENALILYRGNPLVVTVKGVDGNFGRVTGVDSILFTPAGANAPLPELSAAGLDYAIPGYGLACRMGVDFGQLQICAPRRGERINLVNPVESFNVADIFPTRLYFMVNQKRYDDVYLLTSLDFARRLFEQEGRLTSLELKLRDGADVAEVERRVAAAAGPAYEVRNRMEQHGETFRVMAIEKLVAYGFLTFILLVACFNIVGSVSMLIIDKRDNIATLRSLGMDERAVTRVFLTESWLITLVGAVCGLALGLGLCWAQQAFGFLRLGGEEGSFIVDAYPVSVQWTDVALVFATVVAVGFLVVWYPVRYLSRRFL